MISRASFFLIPSALFIVLLVTPFLGLAQSLTYQPLVGIPGINNTATDFNLYINQLYFLSISLAALLAVIKIIIGGVKWMLSDGPSGKSGAKDDIRSALLGLLLIVSAVLILGTINPQLRDLNVLGGAPALNPLPSAGSRSVANPTNQAVTTEQQNLSQSPDNQQAVEQALGVNRNQVQTGTDRAGSNTFSYIVADAPREVKNGFINACMNVTQGGVGTTNTIRTESFNGLQIMSCYRQGPNNTQYRIQL
ncbi:pilin [Patescibacteria group bacterium]|nr:pilin [Patescibacteria group bacterium]